MNNHKDLCLKYHKKSEKLVLPKEHSLSKFQKIDQMIKTPFTIYYDIETHGKYLKDTQQHNEIQNTTHEQLLKPHLIGYILKNNYNDIYSKKVKFLQEPCV